VVRRYQGQTLWGFLNPVATDLQNHFGFGLKTERYLSIIKKSNTKKKYQFHISTNSSH
jgi:hypothetical protein